MSNTLEERCRQLMIQRKFEQCEKEIETAMAENPHCAIPHNLMGILMEKESNHILAMKHFRAAYALDPTYVPARYNMEQYGRCIRQENVPLRKRIVRLKMISSLNWSMMSIMLVIWYENKDIMYLYRFFKQMRKLLTDI